MSKFDNTKPKKQDKPQSKFCSHPGCSHVGTITFSARAEGPWLCRHHFAQRKRDDDARRTSDGMKNGISMLRDKLKYWITPF